MNANRLMLVAVLTAPLLSYAAFADDNKATTSAPLTIDLGDSGGSVAVEPGRYHLEIVNKIPDLGYIIDTTLALPDFLPKPLSLDDAANEATSKTRAQAAALANAASEVNRLKKELEDKELELKNADSPADAATRARISTLSNDLTTAEASFAAEQVELTRLQACEQQVAALDKEVKLLACESSVRSLLSAYGSKINSCSSEVVSKAKMSLEAATSERQSYVFTIPAGASLKVSVATPAFERATSTPDPVCADRRSRTISTDKVAYQSATWKKEFTTPEEPSGRWLVFYGLNYLDNKDNDYFAKSNGTDPESYTITKKSKRASKSFAPSLYFSWIPGTDGWVSWLSPIAWRNGDFFGGVTAGIGFDFDKPTAFMGYGLGLGYNVMLNAGLVYHSANDLAGQYQPGDVITEPLSESQLVEDGYEPTWYVGAAFRFGENPFPKKEKAPALVPVPATPTP